MVRASAVCAAVAYVERGNAEVIYARGVVGAGAESADAIVCALARLSLVVRVPPDHPLRACSLQHRTFRLRVCDIASDLVDKFFERVRAADAEEAAPVRVGVDIDGGVSLQKVRVRLGPFGRTQQSWLFAIPRRIHNRPLRLPPGLDQETYGARLLHQRDQPADGVIRAVDPCVVMVAANNPFVRALAPAKLC